MGKGRCSESMSSAWNCGQPGQVSPQPLSHCHISGDNVGEPLFEGFPLSGEGFDPSITARRIFILQTAKRLPGGACSVVCRVSVCWSQGVVFVCGCFSSNFAASGISRTSL